MWLYYVNGATAHNPIYSINDPKEVFGHKLVVTRRLWPARSPDLKSL
jgi:hypothetical protein